MGLRESLIVDWENKTIEYQGKRMYIIKQFVYENKEYFYAIDLATVNNKNLEIAFLYKVKDDIFAHVEDEELFDKNRNKDWYLSDEEQVSYGVVNKIIENFDEIFE